MNTDKKTKQHGFTLIEFMIASILGLIVIAAVGSLYLYTKKLNDVAMQRVTTQQDLRNAALMISRDARMAGSFGCINLGSVAVGDANKESTQISYAENIKSNSNPSHLFIKIPKNSNASERERSFGVNIVKKDNITASGSFKALSDYLVFYYGMGSSSLKKELNIGDPLKTSSFVDGEPSQTITNTMEKKGYLAISGCSAIHIFKSTGVGSDSLDTNLKVATSPGPNQFSNTNVSIFRYMVSAYVVGKIGTNGKKALYRFELGENGEWQGPELLADNVSNMDVSFLYTEVKDKSSTFKNINSSCPSEVGDGTKTTEDFNNYHFIKQTKAIYSANLDGANSEKTFIAPAATEIKLTYTYPKVAGEDSGKSGNQEYYIYSTIRGGNSCATRILSN